MLCLWALIDSCGMSCGIVFVQYVHRVECVVLLCAQWNTIANMIDGEIDVCLCLSLCVLVCMCFLAFH